MSRKHYTEIDVGFPDVGFPDVCGEYRAIWEESDPSVGFVGGWTVSAEVDCWMIGGLRLTRAQLCAAIGTVSVNALEKEAAQEIADKLRRGEVT